MKRKTITAIVIIAIVVISFAAYYAVYLMKPGTQTQNYDKLAQCLTANGAIMYGTQTCHVCIYQRELLGTSVKYITEVDCIQQYDLCMKQQIGATPTWLINGSFVVGVQTPGQLANESGCVI